ncbi:peroxide/acid stress response protein YhcN [Serratia marcescens]|nr:peroxide/acid stress response protein YhcN [Serratia marcescens]MBH3151534.1 peroxide/acid stress response protein YhcN [Serratia marcescens]MBH3165239.1 peroxide/acid stress response protein YhcN [Serratia marcescens]HEJ6964746.1 peroxide/acid stress response protein YhcN [Serratia marcescens]HEJ7202339.1 peroxide/acid stress response protein YhcN [Serratia marcescens]
MNMKTTLAAFGLLSAISFGASAAQLVTNDQTTNLQSIGTITVSGIDGAPTDIRQALSDKADAKGATAYRVIEARNEGNYHATAEIYK